MIIKKAHLYLPIALLLCSSVVNAEKSVYIAANGLNAEYENEIEETGYSVAVGKYLGNRVSLEAGYASFGTIADIDAEFDVSAFQLSAIGYLPIGTRAGVFARIGAEQVEIDGRINSNGNTISGSDDETNPYYGIGGYFNVTDNLDVRVEYQKHEVFEVDVDTISAGATLKTY